MRLKLGSGLGLAALALWSCAKSASDDCAPASGEVNVYSYREPQLIDPLVKAFTDKTGIKTNVIFAAAGTSALGVFEAAADLTSETGHYRWAIGVDTDQYLTVRDLPLSVDPGRWQPHILTSVLKHADVVTRDTVVLTQGLVILFAGALEQMFRPQLVALFARRQSEPATT